MKKLCLDGTWALAYVDYGAGTKRGLHYLDYEPQTPLEACVPGVVDYYLARKPSFYYVKKSFAPLSITFKEIDGGLSNSTRGYKPPGCTTCTILPLLNFIHLFTSQSRKRRSG